MQLSPAGVGPQIHIVRHRLVPPHKDVADAIETVRVTGAAQLAGRISFEFLVLTVVQSGEVRLATWDKIDTVFGWFSY